MIDFIVDSITSASFLAGIRIDTSFDSGIFFLVGIFFNHKKLVIPVTMVKNAIISKQIYQ